MNRKYRNRSYDRPDIHGERLYVHGATVNEVKRAVGKLAKKVRSCTGCVEVIHTHNGSGNRSRPGIYRLWSALDKWEVTR